MSSHRFNLDVLPEAEDDLNSILINTGITWGGDHIDVYLGAILNALELVRMFPFGGSARDRISPGLMSRPVGSHVIFCRVADGSVFILRIVHKKMDVTSLF